MISSVLSSPIHAPLYFFSIRFVSAIDDSSSFTFSITDEVSIVAKRSFTLSLSELKVFQYDSAIEVSVGSLYFATLPTQAIVFASSG